MNVLTHPDTLQRAAFEAWYDNDPSNTSLKGAFHAGYRAALQPQAAVSLQPAHDGITIDLLNDKVMRQQEAMRLALEALQELVMRYEVLFKLYGPLAYYEGCKFESDMELGLVNAKAAIAALEGSLK